ncbi:hypothetical protein MMC15_004847 [Xylographa vitiligo]|nr:hypothetical protein [Xylographa vitiligo]
MRIGSRTTGRKIPLQVSFPHHTGALLHSRSSNTTPVRASHPTPIGNISQPPSLATGEPKECAITHPFACPHNPTPYPSPFHSTDPFPITTPPAATETARPPKHQTLTNTRLLHTMQFSKLLFLAFGLGVWAAPLGRADLSHRAIADDAVAYPDGYKRSIADDAVAYPDGYKRNIADDAVAYPDGYKRNIADDAVAYPDGYKRNIADDAVAYPDGYKRNIADDAVAYPDGYKRSMS